MKIGDRIVKMRDLKGWSQRELARRVGLNASVMNRIESGERPIKDNELADIATTLGVTSDFLLGITNSMYPTYDEELEKILDNPETQLMFGNWKDMSKEERKEAIEMIKYIHFKRRKGD